MIAEAIRMVDATDDLEARGSVWVDRAEIFRLAGARPEAASSLARAIELFEQKGNVVLAAQARMRTCELRTARETARARRSEL